jgi:hypothetical protein
MQRTYAELSEAAQRAGEAEVIRNEANGNGNASSKPDDKAKGQTEERTKAQPTVRADMPVIH